MIGILDDETCSLYIYSVYDEDSTGYVGFLDLTMAIQDVIPKEKSSESAASKKAAVAKLGKYSN